VHWQWHGGSSGNAESKKKREREGELKEKYFSICFIVFVVYH
jgi:hypothetical protein